jgi:glycosyltransferase involved in cell wall biosynthesis
MPEVHPLLRDHLLAVRDEVLRIHGVRGLDLVCAPIQNIEGMALMATGELPVALSLQPVRENVAGQPRWRSDGQWANQSIAAERWCLQHADLVITHSHRLLARINGLYGIAIERARVSVVPQGLPCFSTQPEIPQTQSPDIVVALFLGWRGVMKGNDPLLQSLPPLLERFPRLRLILANERWTGPGDEVVCTESGSRASHTGAAWLDRVDVRRLGSEDARVELYSVCDFIVIPGSDTSNLTYIEAMRSGKPVVAIRAGESAEIVEDGISGLLVAPGDLEQLADAIGELIASPKMVQEMGTAARQVFLNRFSLQQMTLGYESAFFALRERAHNST